jgi:hypothetical protein
VARTKKTDPLTTTQQLGSLIKSARDLIRKDKGLRGDLDRLPMLQGPADPRVDQALILMGDWCGSTIDTARPRHRDCLNHRLTDNLTIDHSG